MSPNYFKEAIPGLFSVSSNDTISNIDVKTIQLISEAGIRTHEVGDATDGAKK